MYNQFLLHAEKHNWVIVIYVGDPERVAKILFMVITHLEYYHLLIGTLYSINFAMYEINFIVCCNTQLIVTPEINHFTVRETIKFFKLNIVPLSVEPSLQIFLEFL